MAIKGAAVTVTYYAIDTGNSTYKTGDSANHTLKVIADGTQGSVAASPAEIDATNNPGLYKVVIAAGENSGNFMTLHGKSATASVVIIPVQWENVVNVTHIAGAVVSTALAQLGVNVVSLDNDVITAAKIANAAIDNATFAADVGSTAYATNIIALAVRKALDAIDLDHLIEVTAAAEEPTDGSYLDQVMHKAAGQTFDATTDSLEAIRDTLSSATITTVAAVSGDTITVVPYTTWEFTIDGLADLTDALENGVIFTVKEKYTDADSAAILQVQEGIGLLVLNGSTAVTANKASLTVDAGEDEIVVHVNASQTGMAESRALVWDVKKVITEDEDADQMAVGEFHIADEAVTRAVGIA